MGISDLTISINRVLSGRTVFDLIDEAMGKVGLFREPIEPDLCSPRVSVFGNDGSHDSICWPPVASNISSGDVVSASYSLNGAGPQNLLPTEVEVGLEFGDELAIQEVTVEIPVDAFFATYDERERDMVLRIMGFVEEISKGIEVTSADCFWEGEGPWFSYQNGSWDPGLELGCESSGSHALSYFRALVSENHEHLFFDSDSGDVLVVLDHREPFGRALLRNNLVNGTTLDRSQRDPEFCLVGDDAELKYLEQCWPMRRGIRDVREQFGAPDFSLGPVSVSTEAWEQEFLLDVVDQVGYMNLDDRFVVFFREYVNGRVAVSLAGKRNGR